MDRTIQRLWHTYNASPGDRTAGMRLAGALLRVADLDHYTQQVAIAEDERLSSILNYMRAIYLFDESLIEELHEEHGEVYFTDPKHRNIRKYKYVNVYCFGRPLASVRVYTFDEARTTRSFLKNHFSQNLLMPPEQMFLDRGLARIHGDKYWLASYPYSGGWCVEPTILLEDEAAFDFDREDAPPVAVDFTPGTRFFQGRPLTEEDFVTVDTDFEYYETLREFEYSDLPDFARPDESFMVPSRWEPAYAIAGLTTRHQVRGIDGPGWENYRQPIAKIYLGYIYPYWIPDGTSSWYWTERLYINQCNHDEAAAAEAFQNVAETEGEVLGIQLDPCPQAGVQHIEDRVRNRCPYCNNYSIETTLYQPSQLVKYEDADPEAPDVPLSVNQVLEFLQQLYVGEGWGDIYSVNEGEELSVSTQHINFGPDMVPGIEL